ncbi:MAG: FAD-dependent oxidoreductase [Ideonella sp.]|nr:FAD-dependent oxidoreductase [Ideonella sp.]MCC7457412.1 FAD-dependent oxidoreductase [Nitrospira sp.]
MKRVVLLGAGRAHLGVLAEMAREPMPRVQAVLVAPQPRALHGAMLPGWIAGHHALHACSIALEPLVRAARVELARSQPTALDAKARSVTLADGRVAEYDVLSLDVEPVCDRDAIAGAREHGLFLRPHEQFVQLFERVLALAAGRALDVVVIGGGAAGFEAAMALQHRLGRGGATAARVCLVTGDATVLPRFAPAVRERALALLRRARITVLNQRCVEITAQQVLLDNGARLVCDVPVLALPAVAPAWLRDSGLALDAAGFAQVTSQLHSVSHAEVFVAGALASAAQRPLAGSGLLALRNTPPLALNLRRRVAGGELVAWQPSPRALAWLACGERRAILGWGDVALQGRWLWPLKERLDRRFVERFGGDTAPAAAAIEPTLGELPTPAPPGATGDSAVAGETASARGDARH